MTAGSGLFGIWQAEYAQRGIATFPVCEKKPAVRNYLRMGLPASGQLAAKFADADGIGFACGKRSGITVIDIDSPDERELLDALDRFGPTPITIRSGSGNYQAWYRHNGERRRIRPDRRRPIDILGAGYVVAPPSRTSNGIYALISGSLDDVTRLPVLRPCERPGAPANPLDGVGTRIERGHLNEALWRSCMTHAPHCAGWEDLMGFAMKANQEHFYEPLEADEVLKIVANAWKLESAGENFFGGRKGLVIPNEQVDALLKRPDAFILFTLLKRRHWAGEFICANAMARTMPPHGWPRLRFAAARQMLEETGHIVRVRPASPQHGPATYKFKGVGN